MIRTVVIAKRAAAIRPDSFVDPVAPTQVVLTRKSGVKRLLDGDGITVTMRWTPLHSRDDRGGGGRVFPNFTNKGSSLNGYLSGRY
jgi:hypothetical protein